MRPSGGCLNVNSEALCGNPNTAVNTGVPKTSIGYHSAMPESVDILAIAAHRDDVEQTCGGTLLKMAQIGRTTAILDLSRGEMGTRGTMEDRSREAEDARQILRVW